MTYILGSRCKDGVVLIADTKITTDRGARYDYGDKITGEIRSVLTGFSGDKEPFTEFTMRLRERSPELLVYALEKGALTVDKVNLTIKEIMKSLEGSYGRLYTYDILAGASATRSVLTYFSQDGSPEEVKEYKALGSWQYGSVFLQENWGPEMTMETVATIGYFIVRYIEKFGLALGVGTGKNKPNPQIKFLPDGAPDYDPTTDQIQKFDQDARRNLQRIVNDKVFSLDFIG